jgi:hypothetical protein
MRALNRPEDINLAWISEALAGRFPDAQIDAAAITDVILGTSTKLRVKITASGPQSAQLPPSTLIVKGGFEPHSQNLGPLYRNESRYYQCVLPYISLVSPEPFYTFIDASAHHSVVVMEDLCARGVTFCHAQRPQTYEQVERRLAALAALHAQTWESPEFRPGGRWDWVESRFGEWSHIYAERYFKPDVWQSYVLSPRGAAVSNRLHDGGWLRNALIQLGEWHEPMPKCLINGDTHLGNLYMEPDGTPGFFDAQVARAPWHLEVSYHIACALDVVDRRQWEKPLLQGYLTALAAAGAPVPDFATAWLNYCRDMVYGYYIFIINETRFQTEAINTAYASRFNAAILDHDVISLFN